MPNLDHIMPNPHVVPIFWGHEYVANPATVNEVQTLISDLVTGPFMNNLAQYGIARGKVHTPIIIDDQNPPSKIIYRDSDNNLKDEITKRLIKWINDEIVPAPPSPNDINQFYFIIPPTAMVPQIFLDTNDPTGVGAQGWHNSGVTDPSSPPTYYWAIIKTIPGDPTRPRSFATRLAGAIGHELVEQFANRDDGSFMEIGDDCNNTSENYRGWQVQRYVSLWDSIPPAHTCVNGDAPVSLKQFLIAIGFDFQHNGLRALGSQVINTDYIASTMRTR